MTLNGITKNVYSDEWYTGQETVDIAIKLLNPEPNSLILCPFDSDKSLFVKTLSIKDKVIKKVFEYGLKTVLIMPIDALGGVKRHEMYKEYGYPSVYVPSRRIAYYDEAGQLRKGSSFHSVIMTFNQGQNELTWEGKDE